MPNVDEDLEERDTAEPEPAEAEPDDDSDESSDEAMLAEIQENYTYACDAWRETQEERRTDLRFLSGDPWEPEDRKEREEAGRPCINHDELGQYCNNAVNQMRQNKRGVKIEPAGNGASDHTAEFRQNLVRAIEYKSRAQSIYLNAFQAEVEGGYGFCRISRRYVSPDSDDQEICVKPIPNPDSVLYDPDCKEPDWSDAEWCFVVEPISKAKFKRRFPEAKITDFTAEHMLAAKDWINDKTVLVAEYWKIETKDTAKKTPRGRQIEKKQLVQYVTNGVEILERTEQPGNEIPIPAFIGMERYRDDGGGAKRELYSLIRLARDPQMSLAYLNSQQMEEAGLSPKTPYVGYAGQFETDAEAWETATKQAHAFLQVDPIPDGANGQVLPLPRREPFTPNFQAYEIAKDSSRRAIQAAMGIASLPTAMQRDNQKSGVALERIQTQQAIGSFHFSDGYDRAIERAGRIIESWIEVTYDTERDVATRKPDDSHHIVRVNTPEPYLDPKTNQPVHYPMDQQGDHETTISTAPSYESQREQADEFLQSLIEQLPKLPIAPPQAAKLLSMAIRMKQLGPKGDEMADLIDPTANPNQAQQQAQQMGAMHQQLQNAGQVVQELKAELQKLTLEKQGKLLDNQAKLEIEKMKIEAQLAMAEVTTKAQQLSERAGFINDMWMKLQEHAHDVGMQAMDQGHDANQQAAQQDHARQMAGQQAQQEQLAQAQAQAQPQPASDQVPQ